jgi:hypothetical protein
MRSPSLQRAKKVKRKQQKETGKTGSALNSLRKADGI